MDRDFAREMIQSKVLAERQIELNKLTNEELRKWQINWLNPYGFHEDSCFISQVYTGKRKLEDYN